MVKMNSLISLIGFCGLIAICSGSYSAGQSYSPPSYSKGYEKEYYPEVVSLPIINLPILN